DADEGRDLRERLLMDAMSDPNAPLSVQKLKDRGCSITADVWYEKVVLEEIGQRVTAGKIAKALSERVEGITEAALRQRIHKQDLKRIEELERDRPGGAIWPAFDPLKSAETDER